MNDIKLPQPLIPHTYPLWIRIGIGITILFFIISLAELPYYFKINTRVKKS